LYKEATATDLTRLAIVEVNGNELRGIRTYLCQNHDGLKHLRLFGLASTVKIATKTSPKLADKDVQHMLVG